MDCSQVFLFICFPIYVDKPINFLCFCRLFVIQISISLWFLQSYAHLQTKKTSCIVTQLSKNIKAGLLPGEYRIVLDEAYPCTEQEMSPLKGCNLPTE